MIWWLPFFLACRFTFVQDTQCRVELHPVYKKFLKIYRNDKHESIVAENSE